MAYSSTAFTSLGSVSAGGSATSSTISLGTALADRTIFLRLTNGTGLTAGAVITVELSPDGTDWVDFVAVQGSTTSSEVREWSFSLPAADDVRVSVTGHTGGSVTAAGWVGILT